MDGVSWLAKQYLSERLTQSIVRLQLFLGSSSLDEDEYAVVDGVYNELEALLKEIEGRSTPAKKSASPPRNKRSRKK